MKTISQKTLTLVFALFLTVVSAFAQDIIVMRNSTEIKAKIRNIGQTEITYSKWSNQDGPTYTISKSEVRYIQYANGEKDVFENTRPTASYAGGNAGYNGSYSAANTNTNTSYSNTNTGSYVAGGMTGALTPYTANKTTAVPSTEIVNDDSRRARFRGYFYGEFGYSIPDKAFSLAPIIEMGVFFGGSTFLGITTGFKYFPDLEGYFIPVNATARFYFTKNKFAPFADASIGCAIGNKVVFDARLGLGFNAGKFSMGIGYERLYEAGVPYVKIGFNFGK